MLLTINRDDQALIKPKLWFLQKMGQNKVSTLNSDKNLNSLYKTMRPIFMMCRLFGIFPVSGLTSSSYKKVRFDIKSIYTIICLVNVVGQVTLSLLSLLFLFVNGSSPRNYYKALINTAGAAFTVMVVRLSMHWPQLLHNAALIEESLPRFDQKRVSRACNLAAGFVFFSAFVDYALSINFYLRVADACSHGQSLPESFYRYTMPWAAKFIPYTDLVFAHIQIFFTQIIFISNFADVLIMVVSLYLTYSFRELNDLVVLYKDKYPSIWNVLRVHYTKLTRLVRLIDENISPFVLLSFGGNLAIICVHLFKILRKDAAHNVVGCNIQKIEQTLASIDRVVYFSFAVTFMIARTVATALLAARLHSTARASIIVLYEVPTSCYSGEAHRFVEQIHNSTVALSGQHFFYVTQQMILGMAATIATYELVLLQFSDK